MKSPKPATIISLSQYLRQAITITSSVENHLFKLKKKKKIFQTQWFSTASGSELSLNLTQTLIYGAFVGVGFGVLQGLSSSRRMVCVGSTQNKLQWPCS